MAASNNLRTSSAVLESGHDVYGEWIRISIAGVECLLRWIPAGTFSMGSPEQELGRTPDEGPRDKVQINRGFWLFDTPVTQALWLAVMKDNPSRFRGPSRPVERVSFHDIEAFQARVGVMCPELQLLLPTEAQWEYACRAGTQTATWMGDHELQGANQAPVLNTICWYAGNSSVAFKSADGVDSSDWELCQHTGNLAGTHPVGLKDANPWGLHDMLGNVWEWCGDSMRKYGAEEGELADPVGNAANDVKCARGGSWRDGPKKLRASYRDQVELEYNNDFVGFRCVVAL